VKKPNLENRKKQTFDSIIDIGVFNHRMVLSTPLNLNQLVEILGPVEDGGPTFSRRRKNFSSYGVVHFQNNRITVFYNPMSPMPTKCKLEFTDPDIQWLMDLAKLCPKLYPSSIEYTVDLMCGSPRDVRRLFTLLSKYIYIPHQRPPKSSDGQVRTLYFASYPKYNLGFRSGPFIMYERGEDSKKLEKCWPYPDLDRIRIELKVRRRRLKTFGIYSLNDFIKNPQFLPIFLKIVRIKTFVESKMTNISEVDFFSELDPYNNPLPFQDKYFQLSKTIKHIYRHICDPDDLHNLRFNLIYHIRKFQSEWRYSYKIARLSMPSPHYSISTSSSLTLTTNETNIAKNCK
jgi:hypothetical protein